MTTLAGKVALITGAGQGVGRGIAVALAKAGVKVAVCGRTLAKVEDAAREIEAAGGEALAVECNVKQLDSLESCVQAVVQRFGGLNILVNNAQEVPMGKLMDVSDASFEAGWLSGPAATLRLMKLCYPYLKVTAASSISPVPPASAGTPAVTAPMAR